VSGPAGSIVVVGGTSGIGRALAARVAAGGGSVVLTGRDPDRAAAAAAELGGTGLAVDLADPATIEAALAPVGPVGGVVVAALERDHNTIAAYDIGRAQRLATLKLVGYPEVVRTLRDRFTPDASVVLFGGLAAQRPWPGSLTVSSVNGAVAALVRALAVEIAPVRVNAVHPGVIGDSPAVVANWTEAAKQAVLERTPAGRLVTMDAVVDAVLFLLRNPGVNGVNLEVDGGWLLR
jgi:NAD(P)-dependent dehydrogenase (short-subunit alcohol dehydrogenase family)